MPQIRFTLSAQRDLQDINGYTVEHWGVEQALSYIDNLELTVKKLAATPQIGKPCDALKQGLRSFPYQSHVIYFLEEKTGIAVVRVLHERMKAELHI